MRVVGLFDMQLEFMHGTEIPMRCRKDRLGERNVCAQKTNLRTAEGRVLEPFNQNASAIEFPIQENNNELSITAQLFSFPTLHSLFE